MIYRILFMLIFSGFLYGQNIENLITNKQLEKAGYKLGNTIKWTNNQSLDSLSIFSIKLFQECVQILEKRNNIVQINGRIYSFVIKGKIKLSVEFIKHNGVNICLGVNIWQGNKLLTKIDSDLMIGEYNQIILDNYRYLWSIIKKSRTKDQDVKLNKIKATLRRLISG